MMNTSLKTLKKLNIHRIGQVFILSAIFTGWTFAQMVAPTPKPKPKPRPISTKTETPVVAETPITPKVRPVGRIEPTEPNPNWDNSRRVENDDDVPFEKSIEVDSKVNIGLCVSEGNIRINGWERNEIRVFVHGGSKAGFKILKKNANNKAAWLTILGYDPLKDKGRDLDQCLSGEQIELDVPNGSIISRLEGKDVKIQIESVAKVVVKNNEGDIQIRDVKQGVEVKTFEGNISVENSGGAMYLDTINGSILVYNVEPHSVGDMIKTKNNSGSVVLQNVQHSVVEAISISGFIRYTGDIQDSGTYTFNNTSGQILLNIPEKSSCMIQVLSEKGKFTHDFPIKILTENNLFSTLRKLVLQIGSGEANINLVSPSGRIMLKKQN